MDPNFPTQPPSPAQPVQPIVPAMPPMESVPISPPPTMQPVENTPVPPPPPKKISGMLIAGVVLLLLSVLALVGYYLYQSNQSRINVSTPVALTSISPVATADPTADWKTYKTSKYEVKYPSDWKVFLTPLEGEAFFQIKPNSISEEENYPGLFIEFRSSTSTSLRIQEGIYSKMGLSKTATVINGQPATKYSGMLSTKNVGGKLVTGTIQQTDIILEKAGFIYTIGYSYDSSQVDQKQETFFSQILSTFKFTEALSSPSSTPSSTSSSTPTATPL